jgi:hypothetical protein
MLAVHQIHVSRNLKGMLCIALDDATFVRADMVFIDPASRRISGLMGPLHFEIGTAPEEFMAHFLSQNRVILTAPHPQGHEVTLVASLATLH